VRDNEKEYYHFRSYQHNAGYTDRVFLPIPSRFRGAMMKGYTVKIAWKRFGEIPWKTYAIIILTGLLTIYSLIQLFLPYDRILDNLKEYEIHIDKVYLWDSHDKKGSRMKLIIVDGTQTFYLWYPSTEYRYYSDEIKSELLSGKVTTVTAKVADTQNVFDCIRTQKRIVELKLLPPKAIKRCRVMFRHTRQRFIMC